MNADSQDKCSKAGIVRMARACISLAPMTTALLMSSGPWAAGLGAGLPLMLLTALFGYGY